MCPPGDLDCTLEPCYKAALIASIRLSTDGRLHGAPQGQDDEKWPPEYEAHDTGRRPTTPGLGIGGRPRNGVGPKAGLPQT